MKLKIVLLKFILLVTMLVVLTQMARQNTRGWITMLVLTVVINAISKEIIHNRSSFIQTEQQQTFRKWSMNTFSSDFEIK